MAIPSRLTFAPLGAAGTPAQLLGIAGAAWWAWARLAGGRGRRHDTAVRSAVLVFAACVLASFVEAVTRPIDETELRAAQMALLTVTSWLGVLLVAHDGIVSRERLDVLLSRLTTAAALLAGLGLLQFLTGRAYTDLIQLPFLTANTPLYGVADRDGLARPAATALSPIEFGVFLTVCLPLALHLALDTGRTGLRRWWRVAAVAAVIPLSISRSAILGTVVVLAFLLPAWTPERRRATAAAVVGLLLAVFVLVPGMLGSIVKLFTGLGEDGSALSRTSSYPLAWDVFRREPVLGRGLFTFLPKYRILDNQYLLLLVEMGVVGLASVLALFVRSIRAVLRLRREAVADEDRALALCLAAALGAAAASLAFFDAFSFPLLVGLVFLLLGCVGALLRLSPTLLPAAPRGVVPATADRP